MSEYIKDTFCQYRLNRNNEKSYDIYNISNTQKTCQESKRKKLKCTRTYDS